MYGRSAVFHARFISASQVLWERRLFFPQIWSGGTVPFAGFGEACFVKAISGSRRESPYPTSPRCKNGENMPDGFWDCAQRCFQYEPPERPTADLLAQSISEIAAAAAEEEGYTSGMVRGEDIKRIGFLGR
jgi:hypothetical protein